jgi:hypothetical protein
VINPIIEIEIAPRRTAVFGSPIFGRYLPSCVVCHTLTEERTIEFQLVNIDIESETETSAIFGPFGETGVRHMGKKSTMEAFP